MGNHLLVMVKQGDPASASAASLLHVLAIDDKQMPTIVIPVGLEQVALGIFPQLSPIPSAPIQDVIDC
ncbi:hypothetical protein CXR29_13635 [Brevibacterium linens]|nr:hypothetical protein CXR29_13635 [Brevibacterium linens]